MATLPEDKSQFTFDEAAFRKKIVHPLVATNLKGAFTCPPLPPDFDVHTASQADLQRHGLRLRRPLPTDPPSFHGLWDRAMKVWSPAKQIVPELHPHILPPEKMLNRRPSGKRSVAGDYVGGNWSGVCGFNGDWAGVMGAWVVPTVSKPSEAQGNEGGWNSASWVGLDGFSVAGVVSSGNVLQAGVWQKLDAKGNPTYFAWYEWFTAPTTNSPSYIYPVQITNVPVKPGQEVFASVQYIDNRTAGYILFLNLTTGHWFPMTLAPPPTADTRGVTCEWVMEAPDGGEPNSALPKFTPVNFTAAIACSPTWGLVVPTNVSWPNALNILSIDDAGGTILTSTATNVSGQASDLTITFVG
jgi:hypothetical protein